MNALSIHTPLNPPRLIRYKAALPVKQTVVELSFDEAIEAAEKGQDVWKGPAFSGDPLVADQVSRQCTEKDRFTTVLREEQESIEIIKGGRPWQVKANPDFGGELIIEVTTLGAYEHMLQTPEVYEIAKDMEEKRDTVDFGRRMKALGFVTKKEVEAMIGKKPAKKSSAKEE